MQILRRKFRGWKNHKGKTKKEKTELLSSINHFEKIKEFRDLDHSKFRI
jgi:hypothetical protein